MYRAFRLTVFAVSLIGIVANLVGLAIVLYGMARLLFP